MESVTIHNYKEPKLTLGVLGAAGAGVLGMLGWYWLIRLTNYEIGYAAWGIGLLVGFAARKLAGNGNIALGMAAAGCALVAIIGGQYLATNHSLDVYFQEQAGKYYAQRLAFARQVVAATTDDQLRAFAAQDLSDEDQPVKPEDVTAEQLQLFRDQELPHLHDFVSGKMSQQQYEANVVGLMKSTIPATTILKESLGLWTILWLFLGVSSAWRLARAEETAETPVQPTTPTAE